MRWTLAKAGLALFTAGTMGMARPGQAQTSPYVPLGTSTRNSTSQDDALAAGKRQPAPEEMRIELAWMADPATFPCRLGAFRDGNALKVRGFVPTEAVRARAVQIAADQSGMAVVDELRISTNMPMRAVGVPVDNVLHEAAEALAQALGEKANPLKLTATADGEVVVTGLLTSLADKLTVSRSLWAVHGCTSVKNKVTLIRYAEFLPTVSKLTLPLATESKAPDPQSKTPAATKPEPAHAKVVTILEEKSGPTVTATGVTRSKTAKEIKLDATKNPPAALPVDGTRSAYEKDPPPPVPKAVSTGSKTFPPPSESTPHVVPLSEAAESSSRSRVLTLPERMNPSAAPLSESGDPKLPDRKVAIPPERKTGPALSDKNKPSPSGGVPVVVETRTPKTNGHTNDDRVAFAEVRSTNMPSNKVEPAGHKTSPSALTTNTTVPAEGSYVSPGVISYEDSSAAPVSTSHGDPFAERLKERINGICAGAGKNVDIQATGEKRLLIRVQCATREEGERLSRRILQLRELAPYEVSLDIKLAP